MLKSPKKEKQKGSKTAPQGKIEDRTFPLVAFSVDKDILIEIEELEEKMFSASLQNKASFKIKSVESPTTSSVFLNNDCSSV